MPVSLRRLGCTRARARALAAGGVRSAAVAIDHPSSRICSGIHLGAYLGQVLAFDHLLDLGVRLRQRLRGAQLAEHAGLDRIAHGLIDVPGILRLMDAVRDDVLEDDIGPARLGGSGDRKSTRLNSSHVAISYAVFCLKKKKQK